MSVECLKHGEKCLRCGIDLQAENARLSERVMELEKNWSAPEYQVAILTARLAVIEAERARLSILSGEYCDKMFAERYAKEDAESRLAAYERVVEAAKNVHQDIMQKRINHETHDRWQEFCGALQNLAALKSNEVRNDTTRV